MNFAAQPLFLALRCFPRCCLFKEVNGTFCHDFRVMHIGLQCCLDVGMPQAGLYILHIGAGFNQNRGVGVPQGMVIKSKQQFLVDYF